MARPSGGSATTGLPIGTVSFMRTDLEGSMELLRSLGDRYDDLNAEHQAMVRAAISGHGGSVVRTEGDAVFAVFADALAAARTAVDVQRAMAAHPWPDDHGFRVRIGLHAGSAHRAGDDYGGLEVSRAARIADLGWGGQIILSDAVRGLLVSSLADDWTIRDLGRYRLKGVAEPERIYQLEVTGLSSEFPPLRSGTGAAGHLPRRLTTLIGREADLATLSRLLDETRLLTVTGPGGGGKTTLALELARRHADDRPDGAWFIDLQGVTDPGQVRNEIAHGLGLSDGPVGRAADRLLSFVADRELLIVIDNFEQVIEAAGAVRALLDASERSRIIVTSRIPLRLAGEQEYVVQSARTGLARRHRDIRGRPPVRRPRPPRAARPPPG